MARVHTGAGWTDIHGPTLTADDAGAEFFAAAARDTLLIKWCAACDGWAAPTVDACPRCRSGGLTWRPAAGVGELVTWTVVHSSPHPAFGPDMPIVSAIVELAEGPWLQLRLLGGQLELRVGAAVQIAFAHPDAGAHPHDNAGPDDPAPEADASYPVGVLISIGDDA